ncbi:head GIN domain-containing protein [Polluticaenibacter yanchengensis]|uniref:DUF2807 domain-containing protein n=1 Tax=Polluticaenibacter yanchengensis TaxID=3014562 RepID=A0ABT4UJ72_9BACT|nr:DUF2807 domain-containing protein [Chitinophagaceae bacterium LY-5]
MRKLYIYIFLVFSLSITSCNLINGIDESGVTKTEQIDANNFDKIKVSGPFKVYVEPSTTFKVEVEADEAFLPYIKIGVEEDDLLRIKLENNVSLSTSKKIEVRVMMPEVEEVQISGSGNIVGNGIFSTNEDFEAKVSGSGNIEFGIKSPNVTTGISGSGTISLTGFSDKLKGKISGSGTLNLDNIESNEAEVNISGSGKIKVYAHDKLEAGISGSGSIYYKGEPQITFNKSGSGKISKL